MKSYSNRILLLYDFMFSHDVPCVVPCSSIFLDVRLSHHIKIYLTRLDLISSENVGIHLIRIVPLKWRSGSTSWGVG